MHSLTRQKNCCVTQTHLFSETDAETNCREDFLMDVFNRIREGTRGKKTPLQLFIHYWDLIALITWDSWPELAFDLNVGMTGACRSRRTGLGCCLTQRPNHPWYNFIISNTVYICSFQNKCLKSFCETAYYSWQGYNVVSWLSSFCSRKFPQMHLGSAVSTAKRRVHKSFGLGAVYCKVRYSWGRVWFELICLQQKFLTTSS